MITVNIVVPYTPVAGVLLAAFALAALFRIVRSLMSLKFW